jgi:phosphoribosylformylglycinamidine cyclo-ligase
MSYKSAGVDISSADRIKQKIKKSARPTVSSKFPGQLNGFGGFFPLDKKYKNPVLISSTDGVGTKLKIAILAKQHDTLGEDLVNHCVNDILVHGARPLFFLDYIACGKNTLKFVPEIVAGLSRACQKVGCALIGGETAQMPEFYKEGEYDLAGFIVGVVEKDKLIDGRKLKAGDQLLGLASSGLHTNGYTLARKILFEKTKYSLKKYVPELKCSLREELLKVHRCYLSNLLPLLAQDKIKGMAHITGGGIEGNLIRILPEGVEARVDPDSWMVPPVFRLLQRLGKIDWAEMYQTFNMGIGMILVVREKDVRELTVRLSRAGETFHHIGEIVKGKRSVKWAG